MERKKRDHMGSQMENNVFFLGHRILCLEGVVKTNKRWGTRLVQSVEPTTLDFRVV